MIRTRFAPSPTGSLHVGNARVAVLNWLFARRHGGAFILRIEDTDAERTVAGSEAQICRDLHWLGLDWDEGPACADIPARGEFGPYRQSERGPIYRAYAERLREGGLAYPCYCSAAELEARRSAAIEAGRPARYDRRCLSLDAGAVAAFEAEGRRPALRVRSDDPVIEITDVVRGSIRFPTDEIGDFIIMRSDGEATYNFAVVVDDISMRITHVIRGTGHLSNTPRQVLLYAVLGEAAPVFAHVPTVLGPDRQKLSKRHGAQALDEYRAQGYHPDGLINYLSLLAWSSPSGDEVLTRERLVAEASLERVGAADVVFDPVKLRWLSGKHIEALPDDELVAAVRPFAASEARLEPDLLPVAVAAVRTHLQTFGDVAEQIAGFFPPAGFEAARVGGDALRVLSAVRDALAESEWTDSALAAALKQAAASSGARGRALYEPLRRALTGREHGPPIGAVLRVQGREQVLAALDAALDTAPQRGADAPETT